MNTTSDSSTSSPEPCCKKVCGKPTFCWVWAVICVAAIGGVVWIAIPHKPRHDEAVLHRPGHNEIAGPPLMKVNGKDLKATVISPHVDAKIERGKNLLWCSTFQLVWNEGCRFAGSDIHMANELPMVVSLNKKLGSEKDVNADSCLVMSGMVQDGIVKKIEQELERKFHGQADPDLLKPSETVLPPDGWMAYAYFFRELPFEYPFDRLKEPLLFGSAQVASFGFRSLTCRMDDIHKAEQVTVLDYKGKDDFVVALKPRDGSERIVLAKVSPAKTLQKTIETVRSRIASASHADNVQGLEENESLIVPILNFDLRQGYDELCNQPITTAGPLKGVPIVLAEQNIRFRLDERGAILKSDAGIALCEDGNKPRQFIFDKPFLILLERKDGERPYFALWVDNPELLAPFK
jgi:hypothetical protein